MNTAYLESCLTEARVAKMREVLDRRLGSLVVVLDNVHDCHNMSAVLRSCDVFGVQEVHVVESYETFNVNPLVSQGVERWLTIRHWSDAAACCTHLRRRRFSLYATALGAEARPVYELPPDRRTAIVFGNEHRGVDGELAARCDGNVLVPMHGFSQSLNVSVAAAVTLAVLSENIRATGNPSVLLSAYARRQVYREWLCRQTAKRWSHTVATRTRSP